MSRTSQARHISLFTCQGALKFENMTFDTNICPLIDSKGFTPPIKWGVKGRKIAHHPVMRYS
jgi:hypothetical protein